MLKLSDHLVCYDLANMTVSKELLLTHEHTAIPPQPEGSGQNWNVSIVGQYLLFAPV